MPLMILAQQQHGGRYSSHYWCCIRNYRSAVFYDRLSELKYNLHDTFCMNWKMFPPYGAYLYIIVVLYHIVSYTTFGYNPYHDHGWHGISIASLSVLHSRILRCD